MSDVLVQHDELLTLLSMLQDGHTADHELARIDELLGEDAEARSLYLQYISLCAELGRGRVVAPLNSEALSPAAAFPASANRQLRSWPRGWILYAIAACLAAALALGLYLVAFSGSSEPKPGQPGPPIATLINSTGTGVFVNDDFVYEGTECTPGTYSIESGSAQFLLNSRVTVQINGKTRLHMHNPMSASLSRGTASFECPPGSEGFTVHLPRGLRFVDLGTRFEVDVESDDRFAIRVLEGHGQLLGVSEPIDLSAGRGVIIREQSIQSVAADSSRWPRWRRAWLAFDFDGPSEQTADAPIVTPGLGQGAADARGGAVQLVGSDDYLIKLDVGAVADESVIASDNMIGADGSTVWLSFLMQSPSADAEGFAGLIVCGGGGDDALHGRLNLARAYGQRYWTAAPGTAIRPAGYTASPIDLDPPPTTNGPETHWWVVRFDFGSETDRAIIYIDPDRTSAEPSEPNAVVEADDLRFDHLLLRSRAVGSWKFDKIRIGGDWTSVSRLAGNFPHAAKQAQPPTDRKDDEPREQ